MTAPHLGPCMYYNYCSDETGERLLQQIWKPDQRGYVSFLFDLSLTVNASALGYHQQFCGTALLILNGVRPCAQKTHSHTAI